MATTATASPAEDGVPPPSSRPSSSSSSSSYGDSAAAPPAAPLPPEALEPLALLSPPSPSGSPAWHVDFSSDGRYLAACFGSPDPRVRVWARRREGDRWTAGGGGKEGKDGAKGGGDDVAADDGGEGRGKATDDEHDDSNDGWIPLATIRGEHARTIRCVAFAPASNPSDSSGVPFMATASFDGKVVVWEHRPDDDLGEDDCGQDRAPLGEPCPFEPIAQLEGHESEVKCCAWNATGSLLATCGRDKSVWLWECFLPGTVGGGGEGGDDDDDDGGEFECLAVLQGHRGDVKSIAFGPSHGQWGEGEEVLYSASYDDTLKVWAEECGDWYCAATLGTCDDGSGAPKGGAGSADEDGGGADGGGGGSATGASHASTVWSLALAPSGVRLFSGSDDGSLGIWKMHTAAERRRRFPRASAASSTDGLWRRAGTVPDAHDGYAALSADCAPSRAGHGRVATSGGDDRVRVWREEWPPSSEGSDADAAPTFALEAVSPEGAHAGDVNCVRWHPADGTRLVSCGDDGTVRAWRYRR
ncbi:hypothetical protein ACHAWF_014182 [Thalassiosira exigua]